jgi:hypothetical protein
LEEVFEATAAGPLPDPPEEILERAFDVLPRRAPTAGRAFRCWSWAQLVHDTLAQPVPAGVRSSSSTARRLLYRVEEADLDLEVREEPAGAPSFRVTGQLLLRGGSAPDELLAVLWSDGAVVAAAGVDPASMFVFTEVPPGSYRLELWIPRESRVIRIEPIQLEWRE